MATYALLDQADEDALHASRLLNIEEKLYKRLSKRLLTTETLLAPPSDTSSTFPDEGDAPDSGQDLPATSKQDEARRIWKDDMLLDFAAFESNIVRVQFLLDSNNRERERYTKEKLRILATAQTVKEGNTQLRDQLKEAQNTLALRKTYDDLANKITSNRALRPRDEQHTQIERLNREIEDLERERTDYANTWAERREQFGKIVDEGMQMLRLIRDEKEEADRKEGMDEVEEGEASGGVSAVATPRPTDGNFTPLPGTVESHDSPLAGLDERHNQADDVQMSDAEVLDSSVNIPEISVAEAVDEGELEEGEHMNVDS